MEPYVEELRLSGGNVTSLVVKVGDTVRRPVTTSSTSVDDLLAHLARVGFDSAPRALGYDDTGRQILSYAEGYCDAYPSDLDLNRLADVGRTVRRLHDACESYRPPPWARWNVTIAPDREELICHNDLAPWNLVRNSTALTFIDWDGAGPSSRLWDLAYAAHGFVPLSASANLQDDIVATRLSAFIDGYGLTPLDRSRLTRLLVPRIWSMYELLRSGFENDLAPWSRLWSEGHGDVWLADALYVEERSSLWVAALRVT
ncbi:MAG: phosphotransferase enzyme family protein [Acidimicrobiales bacterium]